MMTVLDYADCVIRFTSVETVFQKILGSPVEDRNTRGKGVMTLLGIAMPVLLSKHRWPTWRCKQCTVAGIWAYV